MTDPRPAKSRADDSTNDPAASAGDAAAAIGPVVVSALKPASPIAKGLPGPGLLAHLIVSKYVDHLPLYRLERIYQRQGLLTQSERCRQHRAQDAREKNIEQVEKQT